MSSLAFSFPTLVITIPSTIIVLIGWAVCMLKVADQFGFAILAGLRFDVHQRRRERIFLAQPSIDIMLHATYFVVGHFHLVMGVAAMFGIFAELTSVPQDDRPHDERTLARSTFG